MIAIPTSFSKGDTYSLRVTPSRLTRRTLQLSLGVIWLLDGLLQAQPWMFTKQFAHTIIQGAAMGQPMVISKPLELLGSIVAAIPMLNVFFVLVQLSIGTGLLFKKTVKAALLGSVLWGLVVWYVGNGFGGIFTGDASLLTGLPSAPLLYVIASIALWPTEGDALTLNSGSGALGRIGREIDRFFERLSGQIAKWSWIGLWVFGALFQLLPAQRSGSALASEVSSSASMSPGVISRLDHELLPFIRNHGVELAGVLFFLQLAVGLGLFLRGTRKAALVLGIALSALFWVFGQGVAGLTTGQATDVNTAPLFIFLALIILFQLKRTPLQNPTTTFPIYSEESMCNMTYEQIGQVTVSTMPVEIAHVNFANSGKDP